MSNLGFGFARFGSSTGGGEHDATIDVGGGNIKSFVAIHLETEAGGPTSNVSFQMPPHVAARVAMKLLANKDVQAAIEKKLATRPN